MYGIVWPDRIIHPENWQIKQLALSPGTEHVIDHAKENICGNGRQYDLIVSLYGNYPIRKCRRLLKKSGIYVMIGGTLKKDLQSANIRQVSLFWFQKMRTVTAKSNRDDLGLIAKLAEERRFIRNQKLSSSLHRV